LVAIYIVDDPNNFGLTMTFSKPTDFKMLLNFVPEGNASAEFSK